MKSNSVKDLYHRYVKNDMLETALLSGDPSYPRDDDVT